MRVARLKLTNPCTNETAKFQFQPGFNPDLLVGVADDVQRLPRFRTDDQLSGGFGGCRFRLY